jgi:hypothetical protein
MMLETNYLALVKDPMDPKFDFEAYFNNLAKQYP